MKQHILVVLSKNNKSNKVKCSFLNKSSTWAETYRIITIMQDIMKQHLCYLGINCHENLFSDERKTGEVVYILQGWTEIKLKQRKEKLILINNYSRSVTSAGIYD